MTIHDIDQDAAAKLAMCSKFSLRRNRPLL